MQKIIGYLPILDPERTEDVISFRMTYIILFLLLLYVYTFSRFRV